MSVQVKFTCEEVVEIERMDFGQQGMLMCVMTCQVDDYFRHMPMKVCTILAMVFIIDNSNDVETESNFLRLSILTVSTMVALAMKQV